MYIFLYKQFILHQTNCSVTCVLIIANTNCNPSLITTEILHTVDYRKLNISVFLSHAFF